MPAGSSSTLALAASLRARDDAALERMLRQRGIRTAGVGDWFDLAEALLDRASIQRALERLDRPTLAVIAAASELTASGTAATIEALGERTGSVDKDELRRRADTAVSEGLLGEESGRYAPWDAVSEQLASWPSFGLPSMQDLIWTSPPAALVPVGEADRTAIDRFAGEQAFATTGRVTEIVLELRRDPARRLAKGGVALPEVRRLSSAAGVDPDAVPALLDLAQRAGLVDDDAAVVAVTESGIRWLDLSGSERWAALAGGWLRRLPGEIRELLVERSSAVWDDGLLDFLAWYYPAEGAAMHERIGLAARAAALLGITADATPSTPGRALLLDGEDAAAAAVTGLFPAEVDQVYLQHDLSIVAPGPLAAALDARLRSLAESEARGLASTYRLTAASIARGLAAGESADGILDFLGGISLSGIPQPVDYLIRATAERFGSVRVGAIDPPAAGARSYVRSGDPALIAQLLVDQSLTALGLRQTDATRVTSRLDPVAVYWALLDARYPAVAEDADGRFRTPSRRPALASADTSAPDPLRDLVARLRGRGAADAELGGTAWIARQLELAVRGRTPVIVTVRMPDGSTSDFRLEPASVAGGRLRARDPRAELERTLPLSSITAVSPLT
ncbi:MAG: helicase-associated domain-containing protein [Micrococcales bacterium]|nr:helicase-associated domain-containing protein [Micrococcales bacterium]